MKTVEKLDIWDMPIVDDNVRDNIILMEDKINELIEHINNLENGKTN